MRCVAPVKPLDPVCLLATPLVQLEFRYLSAMAGDESFAKAVNRVFDLMASKRPPDGLFPIHVSTQSGGFTTSKVARVGARELVLSPGAAKKAGHVR